MILTNPFLTRGKTEKEDSLFYRDLDQQFKQLVTANNALDTSVNEIFDQLATTPNVSGAISSLKTQQEELQAQLSMIPSIDLSGIKAQLLALNDVADIVATIPNNSAALAYLKTQVDELQTFFATLPVFDLSGIKTQATETYDQWMMEY